MYDYVTVTELIIRDLHNSCGTLSSLQWSSQFVNQGGDNRRADRTGQVYVHESTIYNGSLPDVRELLRFQSDENNVKGLFRIAVYKSHVYTVL